MANRDLKLTFSNGDIYTNSDIYYESMQIDESICSEEALTFGCSEASQFRITISNPLVSHIGQKVVVEITEDEETTLLGNFYVAEDTHDANRTKRDLVCYDKMAEIIASDVADWYNTILPNNDSRVTLKAFRDSFASHFGLNQVKTNLANDNMEISKTIFPSEISGRDVLFAIGEINGVFPHITRDEKLEYVELKQEISSEITKSDYKSCSYEDFSTEFITKLQIRQEENDIGVVFGEGNNCYVVQDNFLVYGKSTEELQTIANNLYGKISMLTYTPATLEKSGDTNSYLGDKISIEAKYGTITTYILKRSLNGIQALSDTFESLGVEKYEEQLNSVQKSIIQLKGKSNVLERSIEELSVTIEDKERGLYSQIKQNADSIATEVKRATSAESILDSKILQTDEKIAIEVSKLQKEIDVEIKTYDVDYVPTLLNYPAWDFTYNIPCNNTVQCNDVPMEYNDEYYSKNARSVCFDSTTFTTYKFIKGDNGVWYWREVADSDYAYVMQQLAELKIEADKISSTVSQNKIYSDGQIESLSSKITQTASSILTEVKNTKEDLTSQISQNAKEIKLKVSQGNISSEISAESGKISIRSNRFSLESTNCTISEDGTIKAKNVELSGTIISSNGKIGGFSIGDSYLSYGAGSNPYFGGYGVYIGNDGISLQKIGGRSIELSAEGTARFNVMSSSDAITVYLDSTHYLDVTPDGLNSFYSYALKSNNSVLVKIGSVTCADFQATTSYIYGGNERLVLGKSTSKIGFFGNDGNLKQTVANILSPSVASSSQVASKVNELLTALRNYGLIA